MIPGSSSSPIAAMSSCSPIIAARPATARSFVDAATGQWGRKMQDDLDDGVAWLVARGIADPKRVCIMGASYGGYAAMWAAVRNPDIYRCAISFAGISDMPAMIRYDASQTVATRYFRDWRDRVRGEQHQISTPSRRCPVQPKSGSRC